MALVGYFIVFSFVTKQTLEFLLWGTIVPLNFLVGYHCSIVASTPQPMVAFTPWGILHNAHSIRTREDAKSKSPEILDGFYKFPWCFKSFDHLVPSPVDDTQLYHPLEELGLGD